MRTLNFTLAVTLMSSAVALSGSLPCQAQGDASRGKRVFVVDDEPGEERVREVVDEEAIRLRELAQKFFLLGGYESMAATYADVCERPSSTFDDAMWLGHALQLQRDWPAATKAYQRALDRLDAEIESTTKQLRAIEEQSQGDPNLKFQKGSRYPFLQKAQERFPRDWAGLVLLLGHMQLVELNDPAAAAETLSKGLRFAREVATPIAELLETAEGLAKDDISPEALKGASPDEAMQRRNRSLDRSRQALAFLDPLETQRYLALALDKLDRANEAAETRIRIRIANIIYPTSYAAFDNELLTKYASTLPPDKITPHLKFALSHPDREPLKTREPTNALKVSPANPFTATRLTGFDFTSPCAAASLTKLPDGRMLIAYATGDHHLTGIKLSLSRDGGTEWEAPWPFAHNSVFNTRAPSLLVADDGEIWMLCISMRLSTARFASAPYQLWLTHSRDGKTWSKLQPLQMESEKTPPQVAVAQYQHIPQLIRLPGHQYGVIWGNQFGTASSPGRLSSLKTLPLPNVSRSTSNTQMVFDSKGRCHVVVEDFYQSLNYTRSDDMQTWSPLQQLGQADKNSSVQMPQLVLDEDRVALLYEKNNGSWLQRGTLTDEGLKLGPAIQITDHLMPLNGSRLFRDGDRFLVAAGVRPYVPGILSANLRDLLAAPEPAANPEKTSD